MSKVEELFKKDFDNSVKFSKKFDLSQLPSNETRRVKRLNPWAIIVPSILCCCVAGLVVANLPFGMKNAAQGPSGGGGHGGIIFEDGDVGGGTSMGGGGEVTKAEIPDGLLTFQEQVKKNYSKKEIKAIEINSFKSLNSVSYPTSSYNSNYTQTERETYYTFADKVLKTMICDKNIGFSPISLYASINFLSSIASEDALNEINSLLGMDEYSRNEFFKKVIKNNYSFDKSTGNKQINSAMFFSNKNTINASYIAKLTSLYCEAFQIDYSDENAVNSMVDWAKQAMNCDALDKGFFEITENKMFDVLSSLYFETEWFTVFNEDVLGNFSTHDGNVVTKYMRHEFVAADYRDHGDYVTFSDKFTNGSDIQYVVPKNKTIETIISENNIFDNGNANAEFAVVNFKGPHISLDKTYNFIPALKKLGCNDIFDSSKPNFNNMFVDLTAKKGTALSVIKQKSYVNITKKGIYIKELEDEEGIGGGNTLPDLQYTVTLNKPFAYIIRDNNNIPLFTGIVQNPNA